MTEFQGLILQAINAALLRKKIIVRRINGELYLAQFSIDKKKRIPTAAQIKQTNKFSAAATYAREALANPELQKIYQSKATQKRPAFNRAFTDYLKPPEIRRIDASAYNGKVGSTITIKAIDDFQIKAVDVNIFNAEGDLVEKGPAMIDPIYRFKWIYTATKRNKILKECMIKVVAKDHAENTGEHNIIL
jgi:hypothetical protein